MTAPPAASGPFSGPIRLLLCASLLFGGGALVVRGWQSATTRADVEAVAIAFLEAVRDGDGLGANGLLAEEFTDPLRAATFDWSATPGATVAVGEIHFTADGAVVESRIELDGYATRPVLGLKRNANDEWRITSIEGLNIDPRWVDEFEGTLDERDEELTDLLRTEMRKDPWEVEEEKRRAAALEAPP